MQLRFAIAVVLLFAINDFGGGVMVEVSDLADVLWGDVRIARYLFNDPRKRRLVPKLKAEGWPIFDLAGKNAALPSELSAEARVRFKLKSRGRKPRSQQEITPIT
jgi:hypothetical protein